MSRGYNTVLKTLLEGKMERKRTGGRQGQRRLENIKRWAGTRLTEKQGNKVSLTDK